MVPKIISGSSGGSIIAGISGCLTKEDFLKRLPMPGGGIDYKPFFKGMEGNIFKRWMIRFKRLFTQGVLLDIRYV